MPVFSKISESTSKISKSDATTPRMFGVFSRRAKDIAQHLDNSNDPRYVHRFPQDSLLTLPPYTRQQEFESVLANVEERLADVDSGCSSGISTFIAPSLHIKKKEIIYQADKRLDSFQVSAAIFPLPRPDIPKPPPKGHEEEMKKATLKDEEALESILKRVSQADEELLKGVSEQLPPSVVREGQPILLARSTHSIIYRVGLI
jgi:hypothetical protein